MFLSTNGNQHDEMKHPGMRRPAPRAYIAGLHAWTTEV